MRTTILRELQFIGVRNLLQQIPALATLQEHLDVQFIAEDWDHANGMVSISGQVVIDAKEVALGDLKVRFGQSGLVGTRLPFAFDLPATLVEALLFIAGEAAGLPERDAWQVLLPAGTPIDDILDQFQSQLSAVSLTFGPLPVALSFATDWLVQGKRLQDSQGNVTGIEPLENELPIEVPLGVATLQVSGSGLSLDLDNTDGLTLPPLVLKGTALAFELEGLALKISDGPLPAGMERFSAEDGFNDGWRGLFARRIRIWNLDKVMPGAPSGDAQNAAGTRVEMAGMAIDRRGLTGDVIWSRPPDADNTLDLTTVTFGFDRAFYPTVAVGQGLIRIENRSGGPLEFRAGMEIDPFSSDPWRLDVGVTAAADEHLLETDGSPALIASVAAASAALGNGDLALLLGAVAVGAQTDIWQVDQLRLNSAALEGTISRDGFSLTARLSGSADLTLTALDEPVPLNLGLTDIAVTYDNTQGFSAEWTFADGLVLEKPLSVEIGEVVTLERVSLRQRDGGQLAIEFGLTYDGSGDVAIGGMPNIVTLVYSPGPPATLDLELRRDGQEITILVPGSLYAKGSLRRGEAQFPQLGPLSWGDALTASLSVYLIGDGSAKTPEDHLEKSSYLYALDLGLLSATREDGLKAMVLTGDLAFKPGLPLGATGAALYGLGLTYAQNAEPNADDGAFTDWFLRTAPEFSTHAQKWRPRGDRWGFGASVVLGSLPDDARAWNVAAGLFLLLPGPVIMITGKGSVFAPPPTLPKGLTGKTIEAPFAAAVSLDLLRDRFTAELVGNLDISKGDAELLTLQIPARVDASLKSPIDMELAIGRFAPKDARVRGRALNLYDISCYLMATTRGIDDFPEPGRDLPAFAIAYGGAGGLSTGFSSAIAELTLRVEAGFDLGVSLADPPLLIGRIYAEGVLVARIACIGVNMGLSTQLLVVAPDPFELSGRATIRIGLPWPLPDIKFSGSFRIGDDTDWPSGFPMAADPIAGISLFARPNGTKVLQNGDSFDALELGDSEIVEGVPLDAGILIAFRAPVGNENPQIGALKTQADDGGAEVWEVASTGETKDGRPMRVGWRHVVTDVALRKGGSTQNIVGGWSLKAAAGQIETGANTATGGQGDRRELYLIAPLDAPVEARYGTGAKVLGDVIDGWSPCAEAPDPKALIHQFSIPSLDSLGLSNLGLREPAYLRSDHPAQMTSHAPNPVAHVGLSFDGPGLSNVFYPAHTTLEPIVLPARLPRSLRLTTPLDRPQGVISLPTAVFGRNADVERAKRLLDQIASPVGTLDISMPQDILNGQVFLLVREGTHVDAKDAQGQKITLQEVFNSAVSNNETGANAEIWRLMRLSVPAGETARLSAVMLKEERGAFFGRHGAVLIGASYSEDVTIRRDAQQRLRAASSELVSDLGAQSRAWANGNADGLLEPGATYDLTVTVESQHVRQIDGGALDKKGPKKTWTKTVRFKTETDIGQPLIAQQAATPWAPDITPPWNVSVTPGEGEFSYRKAPLVARFADAVNLGRIAGHKRDIRLKLTHESGRSVEEMVDLREEAAKRALSDLQDIVSDYVEGQSCLMAPDPIWLTPKWTFDTVLEPGRYEAELIATASGNRASVVLHQWRFNASRWSSRHAQLSASRISPILCAGKAQDAVRAVQSAAPANLRPANDQSFEKLFLGALSRPPLGQQPLQTIELGVYEDGCGWLLLDGPEPIWTPGLDVFVEQSGRGLAIQPPVSNADGSRLIIVFDTPADPGTTVLKLGTDASRTFDTLVFNDLLGA